MVTPTDDGPIRYDPATFRVDDSLGFLLGRVKSEVMTALDAELVGLDLTTAQWVVLMRLGNGQICTAADLCRHIAHDTGAMTRMLDRLEERGLIRRERSTEDRRAVQLSLTDQGRALYPQLPVLGTRAMNRLVRDFSPEEVDLLKSLLRRMMVNGASSAESP